MLAGIAICLMKNKENKYKKRGISCGSKRWVKEGSVKTNGCELE